MCIRDSPSAAGDLERGRGDAYRRDPRCRRAQWRHQSRHRHPHIDPPLLEGLAAESQVRSLHAEQGQGTNPEGLRRLLLAMSQDLRVVPILLARHLARLREAVRMDSDDAAALARLTRDIHAPLAKDVYKRQV